MNIEEEECSKLSDWKEKVLKHCYSGIKEVGSFTKIHPDFYFPGLEQIREEFYNIIKMLQ